ncbi:MAG TPA: hypothetical protein PK317_02295 [Coprothermobacter proteolyticus]|nr:hypothetical protein [Coprothermobacter proteolyticus]
MDFQKARAAFPNQWFVIHADGSGWARFDNVENAIFHAGVADTIESPVYSIQIKGEWNE